MHTEKVYQVDDISYEVQEKENRIALQVWGKATSTGWEEPSLKIKNMDHKQENLQVDFIATPPHEHQGIHDDTVPMLTDIYAEEYFDLDTFTEPIFSVTVYAQTNELTKYTNDVE